MPFEVAQQSSVYGMAKTLTLAMPWILCSVLQLLFNPDLINYNLFVQCTFSHVPVEAPIFLYVYLLINIPKHFRKKRNTQCIHTGTSTICCAENYKEGRGMSTPCVKKKREEQSKRHDMDSPSSLVLVFFFHSFCGCVLCPAVTFLLNNLPNFEHAIQKWALCKWMLVFECPQSLSVYQWD